ncbi:MAG: hypothetical protein COA94_07425 [Rickettsiales bacterium]|nr:MAG: hypothetical protein COA94_07425 [Rickettsiales bacterium]
MFVSQSVAMLAKLREFARELNAGYIESFAYEEQEKESVFANYIVSALCKYKELLPFLNSVYRHDLEDCLKTHAARYVKYCSDNNQSTVDVSKFESDVKKIVQLLEKPTKGTEKDKGKDASAQDLKLNLIRELTCTAVKNAQLLFAEQTQNPEAKASLQAFAIAFSFEHLDADDQNSLFSKLLLTKEIWCIDSPEEASKNGIKYNFYHNASALLKLGKKTSADETLMAVIKYLVCESQVLPHLSDEQLISLYDRLKNHEWSSDESFLLLSELHKESRFRYSYNRLSDSGYDLLNRFQGYDAMAHQIENLEFSIVETYLITRRVFFSKLLKLLIKHADNIRGFNLNKNEDLLSVLKKMDIWVRDKPEKEKQNYLVMLSGFNKKLKDSGGVRVQKRYTTLDKFTVRALHERYKTLFANIGHLLEHDELGMEFLNKIFLQKLTKEFYLPNLANSVKKLRQMDEYQKEVKAQLLELNLIDIFQSKGVINEIHSLNFSKVAMNSSIKLPSDYIGLLTQQIVAMCTPSQLEALYSPLATQDNLSNAQLYLKSEIKQEIHRGVSIKKMIYSIIRGKKKEYDHLKNLKERMLA